MTDRTPARVARESRRAAFARTLARFFLAHDLTDREAERLTGVAHQHVAQWRDPDAPRAMSFADALALPPALRRALAELLVGAGYAVVKLPEGHTEACDLRAISLLQREASDVVAKHLGALADGRLDAREGELLERECDELISAVLPIRERAREAQRERVVALRRARG